MKADQRAAIHEKSPEAGKEIALEETQSMSPSC
jgi:hypothetical protein